MYRAVRNECVEECKKRFNEPAIVGLEVGRVIGFAEDDIDYYYVVLCPRRGKIYHSMVGGVVPLHRLKGQNQVKSWKGEDWDDYTRIDNWLGLNGAPRQPEFVEEQLEPTEAWK